MFFLVDNLLHKRLRLQEEQSFSLRRKRTFSWGSSCCDKNKSILGEFNFRRLLHHSTFLIGKPSLRRVSSATKMVKGTYRITPQREDYYGKSPYLELIYNKLLLIVVRPIW